MLYRLRVYNKHPLLRRFEVGFSAVWVELMVWVGVGEKMRWWGGENVVVPPISGTHT